MGTLDPQEQVESGQMHYPVVDPNGAQGASTVAGFLGFVALAGSGNGDEPAQEALRLFFQGPDIVTAGFSLAAIGRSSLFTAGLVLVGLSVVLNVASLIMRRQYSRG